MLLNMTGDPYHIVHLDYQPRPGHRFDLVGRCHMPYCIHEHQGADNKPAWIVLNREYKPIGFPTSASYVYDAFPIGIRPHPRRMKAWNHFIQQLDQVHSDWATWWFYNDRTAPWNSAANMRRYTALLAKFMMISIVHVPLRPDSSTYDDGVMRGSLDGFNHVNPHHAHT